MKFTKIPEDTFQTIQLNAGILLDDFTPSTQTMGNLLGATTGGIQLTCTPEFSDFGEDIDSCPKNTKELMHLDNWTVTMSGTFVTISADLAKRLVSAADATISTGLITPRNDLAQEDFMDMWWILDYSDINEGPKAGFVAIHLINGLSTGGFKIQSGDNSKGQFAFEFTGHYSIAEQDKVPFELYVKRDTSSNSGGGGNSTP